MMKSAAHTEVVGATPIVLGENREELAQLLEKITSGILYTEQEKRDFSDFFYCMDELVFSHGMEKQLFLLILKAIATDVDFLSIPLDFEWIIDLHTAIFKNGNRKLFDTFYMQPHKIYLKPKTKYKKENIWYFIEINLATRFAFDCKKLMKKRNIFILNPHSSATWALFPFWLYKNEKDIYLKKSKEHQCYKAINHISFEQAALYLPPFLLRQLGNCNKDKLSIEYIKHLAEGENIRKASFLPFKMTKKMAHHFHNLAINPRVYNYVNGNVKESPFALLEGHSSGSWQNHFAYPLVYAFVKGTGGDNCLVGDFFGVYSSIDDYDFQKSIVEFIVRFGINNVNSWRRLLGYLSHMRHESGNTYSLKGRTLLSVTRSMNAYYEEQQRISDRATLARRGMLHAKWKGANYKNYHKEEESEEYQIIQLLESIELTREGRLMSHCVGGYIAKCMIGRCSIWSLRKREVNETYEGNWKSLATIEIDKSGNIIQAKAKYNYRPDEKHMEMIREWAVTEGIKIISQ